MCYGRLYFYSRLKKREPFIALGSHRGGGGLISPSCVVVSREQFDCLASVVVSRAVSLSCKCGCKFHCLASVVVSREQFHCLASVVVSFTVLQVWL